MNLLTRIRRRINLAIYPKKIDRPRLEKPLYKDRHTGEDFLIIALGPSLGTYKEKIYDFIKKKKLNIIGVNNCFDMDIDIGYFAFTNRHRFVDYGHKLNDNKSCILLIAPYIPPWSIKEILNKDTRKKIEYIMYVSENEIRFDIDDEGIIQGSCKSVAVLMIAVAIVMGAKNIYVAGLDGYSRIIESGKKDIHYNLSQPKFNIETEKEQFLEHYYKSEAYQVRFLREIREFQIRHGKEPYRIITPTVHRGHYDPSILGIG